MIYKPLYLYDTESITIKTISFVSFYVRQQLLGQSNAHNNIVIIKYTYYMRYQDQDHHAVEASPLLVCECIQLECTARAAHTQDKTA